MVISGIHRFSLIDYPGKISCTVFAPGCNFRCPYCHNPELVDAALCNERFLPELFFEFLQERKGKLDGVVITGGEPTLQEDLPEFIKRIKEKGFLVKLDTNGTNPGMIKHLSQQDLVDFIAMDIKTPIEKYHQVIPDEQNGLVNTIQKSISIIINSKVDHEFRTTAVKEFITKEDIIKISTLITGAKKYVLQRFVPSQTLSPEYENAASFSESAMEKICRKLTKNGLQTTWR